MEGGCFSTQSTPPKSATAVYVVSCFLAAGYDVPEVISNMDVSENPGNTIQTKLRILLKELSQVIVDIIPLH